MGKTTNNSPLVVGKERAEKWEQADIIWILSPYIWSRIPHNTLRNKKIVVTIHHMVPEKFTRESLRTFLSRDRFVDCYHVPCKQTQEFITDLSRSHLHLVTYLLTKCHLNQLVML